MRYPVCVSSTALLPYSFAYQTPGCVSCGHDPDVRWSFVGFAVSMVLWAIWLGVFYANIDTKWGKSLLVFDRDDEVF